MNSQINNHKENWINHGNFHDRYGHQSSLPKLHKKSNKILKTHFENPKKHKTHNKHQPQINPTKPTPKACHPSQAQLTDFASHPVVSIDSDDDKILMEESSE
jgi:hypothetical protein